VGHLKPTLSPGVSAGISGEGKPLNREGLKMSTKVYEIITEKIVEELKRGDIPWHQPWVGGRPKNLISKKDYNGINVFLLSCQRFASPYWVTYNQAQELGGNVKKGEKSTMIVFWKQFKVKDDTDGEITEKTIPLLRYYRVFNVEQCEGIDPKKIPALENSAAYIKSWLRKLQDDPKMVILAAAQAQKAADFILNNN